MRPIPDFDLHRPESLREALALMAELESVRPIAGGTDILPLLRDGVMKAEHLVDIRGLRELRGVGLRNGILSIGAATTLTEVLEAPLVAEKAPVLREAVGQVGSVQTRNQGTLAGNICNASPAADTAPALMVLDAQVSVDSLKGSRRMSVSEIFAGPKMNSLAGDELVTEILISVPPQGSGAAFKKLGRRRGITLAVVNAAAYLEMEGETCKAARVALGAIAATPIRVPGVEEMLEGKTLSPELLEESSRACHGIVSPVDDVRSSAEYRREMSCVLVKRALIDALVRAGGTP